MEASSTERGRRMKLAAEIGLVQSSRGRQWGRALRRNLLHQTGKSRKEEVTSSVRYDSNDDEEEAVEDRMKVLQRLVPGGEEMPVDRLLLETADYIEALQGQVSSMQALARFLDGLEKEESIMAG